MINRKDSFCFKDISQVEKCNNLTFSFPERNEWFSNYDKPNSNNHEWMSKLNDNNFVYSYSYPGTHDSCARHGGIAVQTQSWSIKDQLTAGIRFFDIRGRVVENVILIYHGFIYQEISLESVLESMELFLRGNPSEGLIIRLKEELDAYNPADTFENIFIKRYVKAFEGLIILQDDYPTIKSIRGKVWICKDRLLINTKPFYTFNVQDYFDLNNDSIEHKNELILEHLNKSNNDKTEIIYANFCSATGILSNKFPSGIAKQTNKIVWDNKQYKKIGIIIMDFPGEKLIKDIIDRNFN